jgi:tRNA threonylcarbamoyladenosine biosynthesis protein TsaB
VSIDSVELSIDTASSLASIALSREGALQAELTWDCGRQHSSQLLPAIDWLLTRQALSKEELRAIFVCLGPGSYAGVRSGVSTGKGLAFGLQQPLVGIGRLEIEAYAFAATRQPVAAIHKAGRNELAWATYVADPAWKELSPPRLSQRDEVLLPQAAIVTGEVDADLAVALVERGLRIASGAATVRHAALLAELGWQRLSAGRTDDPNSLEPLYLREPAIGPQS